jgi:type IV secretion system protein VirB6
MDFATSFLNKVDLATQVYIFNAYNSLSTSIAPVFTKMLALFFILYGLAVWSGYLKPVISELLGNIIKITIIYILITQWGWFSQIFVTFFTNFPSEVGGVLLNSVGAPGMGNANSANSFIGNFIMLGLTEAGNVFSFGVGILQSILIALATIILGAYLLYLIALSKIALALLLGTGPIFIVLLLYKGTNKMFEAWVQQCVNYALIPIFAYGVGIIVIGLADQVLRSPNIVTSLGNTFAFLIYAVIGFLVLLQVTAKAAAIAGGIQLNPMHREIHTMGRAGKDTYQGAKNLHNKTQGWGRKYVPNLSRSSITRK